jgi:hypothetical protein
LEEVTPTRRLTRSILLAAEASGKFTWPINSAITICLLAQVGRWARSLDRPLRVLSSYYERTSEEFGSALTTTSRRPTPIAPRQIRPSAPRTPHRPGAPTPLHGQNCLGSCFSPARTALAARPRAMPHLQPETLGFSILEDAKSGQQPVNPSVDRRKIPGWGGGDCLSHPIRHSVRVF